jgi:glycosyltransferase involved in cell wall biosynthesis
MRNNAGEKRIAFCGTRGIPANYGGFETAVDEISRKIVEQGLEVDVFCRSTNPSNPTKHQGRKCIFIRSIKSRKLDTVVSSIFTGLYLLHHRNQYSHVFWFNNANLPGILLTLLARIPTTINTDGLEWRRKKWSLPFKGYYLLASFLISLLCGRLISDSRSIQNFYWQTFKKRTLYIPYGSPRLPEVSQTEQLKILDQYSLVPGSYLLQITRFEPDNYPLEIAKGFISSGLQKQGYKHVVVGLNGVTPYSQALQALSQEPGVVVLPAVYDPSVLYALRRNCFCYVHGNSVGGTNPALLEAMATCPRVLAIDCVFSRETLGDTGSYFMPQSISDDIRRVMASCNQRNQLGDRVYRNYQWEAVSQAYMAVAEGKDPAYEPG